MTVTVTAYDTGLLKVDGRPIDEHGWLGVAEHILQKLGELQRQAAARVAP